MEVDWVILCKIKYYPCPKTEKKHETRAQAFLGDMVFRMLSILLAWLGAALASTAKIPEGLLDSLSADAQKMNLIDREELAVSQREFFM